MVETAGGKNLSVKFDEFVKSLILLDVTYKRLFTSMSKFRTVERTNKFKLRRKHMKSLILSFILFFGISSLFPACALQSEEEAKLKNVDAIQAIAIANQWKWSKKEINSSVTPREVVFKFPDGKVKKIPLPKEKMLVAVAPYINRTHR